jgi:Fungal Zn(2)-Cys(6) binuclear cluster domain
MSFNATNPSPNPNVSPPSSTSGATEGSQSRRKHPCVLCQQRKVKCDRSDPCANCVKARVECVSPTTLPPRRRKKRFPEAELLARLRKYEDHLRRYGADIDAINREGPTTGPPSHPTINPTNKTSPLDNTPLKLEPIRSLSIRRSIKHLEK